MKKILVAFDGSVISLGALDYALNLVARENSLIVGVFIEDLSYLSYVTLFGEDYFTFDTRVLEKMEKEVEGKLDENMAAFEAKCRSADARYKIHLDKGVPSGELIRESLYADVILIGYQTFFSSVAGEASILKDVLIDAECPVMAVPEQYKPIQSLLLTFDGKAPSVFAIKQFTQLFSELSGQLPATLLHITKSKEDTNHDELMEEYLNVHYPKISFEISTGPPEEVIMKFADSENNPLLVMGSFGRSAFSRFFSRGTANKLLKDQSLPIFVAHK